MMHAIKYAVWLVGQVIAGAIAVGIDVSRRRTAMDPIVVEYPLRVTEPWQIAAFSTSITMTPGTLSCGLIPPDNPEDPTILLVQAVYGNDPAEVIAGLADMEERLVPAIKDIDHGAPGQGSGDPVYSTVVAGHSDTMTGPTETDEHHQRSEAETPRIEENIGPDTETGASADAAGQDRGHHEHDSQEQR